MEEKRRKEAEMEAGLQPIVCPRCGATEIKVFAKQGKCEFCGVSFTITSDREGAKSGNAAKAIPLDDLFSGEETSLESFDLIGQVTPEFEQSEFVRACWIKFALDAAPLEIFDQEIEQVETIKKQILMNEITADTSFMASVGYDRVETYTVYESRLERRTYYEDGKEKSRLDTVQEPVTKQRTVTDWQAFHGNRTEQSVVVVDNLTGELEDIPYVTDRFLSAKKESVTSLPTEKAAGLQITNAARKAVIDRHRNVIEQMVESTLPGDRHKDLNAQISVTDSSSSLHLVDEYSASVHLRGKQYTEKALAFGGVKIVGDTIENGNLPKQIVERKQAKVSEEIGNKVNRRVKVFLILAIVSIVLAGLLAGLDTSQQAMGIAGTIVCAIELIASIYIMRSLSKEGETMLAGVKQDAKATFAEYMRTLRERLDRKLLCLGLDPITNELDQMGRLGESQAFKETAPFVFPRKKARVAIFCLLGLALLAFFGMALGEGTAVE